MQVDLSKQAALVTGAARGIGRAIADALARNGARVFFADIDRAEAEKSASCWPSATAVTMDVTDSTQIQAVMDGDLDHFVNAWLRAGCPAKRMAGVKEDVE